MKNTKGDKQSRIAGIHIKIDYTPKENILHQKEQEEYLNSNGLEASTAIFGNHGNRQIIIDSK